MSAVPKLRFKEFNDPWIELKVKDFSETKTGSRDTQNRIAGGLYPFFVRSDTIERINTYDFDGEAILTSGDGVGVGKNFHYIDGRFDYHQRVYAIRNFSNKVSGKFFFQFFKEHFYKRVMRLSAKNSVDSVRMSMITDMAMSCPTLQEQKKIADFLGAVDNKIAGLRERERLLTDYKKGVMQKIFAQDIRFKADDGSDFSDWINADLGEICDITTGRLDANAAVEGGKFPFYTCAKDVFTIDTEAFDTEALLISGNGANVGYIHYCDGKFNAYQRTYVLDNFQANIFYIEQFLIKNLKKRIYSEAKEGNTPYIVMGTLTELKVQLPHPDEQQKIADFLSAIDDKITAVSAQILHMQDFKKGLLQQMFV